MKDASVFDYAIVGAGLSGLVLAWLLCESSLKDRSILLIDGARDDDELRTFSFWSSGPIELEALVEHRWRKLRVQVGDVTHDLDLRAHDYRTLFFADLQRETKAKLARSPRNVVIMGRLSALAQDAAGATLSVGEETFRARWVFDSRFRLADLEVDAKQWHSLRQHFHGWIVRADHDAFDPRVATLLDFRSSAPAGEGFFYVLPTSRREGLVELVTLERIEAEPMLREYLSKHLGIEHFDLLDHEAGISPMTEQPFEWREGDRVRRIGIPAGRLKASTGYALTRILDDAKAIVRSLESHGHPFVAPSDSWFYRCLDAILLEVWQHAPHEIPRIFAAMFAKNPPDLVLRFLDEKTNAWEVVQMIMTLPRAPFVKAAVRWLARALGPPSLPNSAARRLPPKDGDP